MLNFGSSTEHYRTVMQPDIDRKIFGPLAERGYKVLHVDRKADQGVDLVGDLEDPAFVGRLKVLHPDLVFCNNLLMHLRPKALRGVIEALSDIVPKGSRLFVSSSALYPHTSDPYDNGLRTDEKQLAGLFGSFRVEDSGLVAGSRSLRSDLVSNSLLVDKFVLRAMVPVYKPRNWYKLIKYLPKLGAPYAAACAILRKA